MEISCEESLLSSNSTLSLHQYVKNKASLLKLGQLSVPSMGLTPQVRMDFLYKQQKRNEPYNTIKGKRSSTKLQQGLNISSVEYKMSVITGPCFHIYWNQNQTATHKGHIGFCTYPLVILQQNIQGVHKCSEKGISSHC